MKTIRAMTRSELETAIGWAAAEGWSPGLNDAQAFWKSDPEGFLALDVNGEMVGSGSVVSYDGQSGFMGMFIIKPEMRRQKLGTEFWFQRLNYLQSRLNSEAAIGMDGVIAMTPFYERGGFAISHLDLRMEKIGQNIVAYDKTKVHLLMRNEWEKVFALDRECFGFEREKFLRSWLSLPESKTYIYKEEEEEEEEEEEGQILGFGTIRRCIDGWKIGPLFAQNINAAEQIFYALNAVAPGDRIMIDVPETNTDARNLIGSLGFKTSFECARMYSGVPPQLPYAKIFGVTTLELG